MRAGAKLLSLLAAACCAVVPIGSASGTARGAAAKLTSTSQTAAGGHFTKPPRAMPAAQFTTTNDQQFSSTNDQEPGVDEPDVAKTNGQLLVVLRHQPLGVQVVDVASSPPSLGGFARLSRLSEASGLFLVGEDAVVVGERISPVVVPARPVPTPIGNLAEVDLVSLSNPAVPEVVGHFDFQGQLLAARLIGSEVVLALAGSFFPPAYAAGQRPAAGWDRNSARGPQAGSSSPSATSVVQPAGASPSPRTATSVLQPAAASTVSVVALDPTSGKLGKEVTVRAPGTEALGAVVYATAAQLFVAAEKSPLVECCPPLAGVACPLAMCPLIPVPRSSHEAGAGAAYPVRLPPPSTEVFGFDISRPGAPVYLGNALVPGALSDQYALSYYGGYLRVVTTVNEFLPVAEPAAGALPGTRVTVLEPASGTLAAIASLSGISPGGYLSAVLFQGGSCYLVTSPRPAALVTTTTLASSTLTVVDLSNPAKPSIAGTVSLPGASSLLQPLGGGLLAALGEPRQAGGLQLEVLDVSSEAAPTLVSHEVIGENASSLATSQHHALLWWPASRLLAFPVNRYANLGSGSVVAQVEAWAIGTSGEASLAGTVSQPGTRRAQATCTGAAPGIEEALVVGSHLLTVSDVGVLAAGTSTFATVAWLPYPAEQTGCTPALPGSPARLAGLALPRSPARLTGLAPLGSAAGPAQPAEPAGPATLAGPASLAEQPTRQSD